jgi:transcription initiation factor TFIID TATA-box-binding protein
MLNRLGERLSFMEFTTQNIVSSVDLKIPLQLHLMQASNTSEMAWENRKFPGLIWRDGASKLVLLCFRSGRVILTGAKSRKQIDQEWGRLWSILMKFTDTRKGATKSSRDYAAELRREAEKMPCTNEDLFGSDAPAF